MWRAFFLALGLSVMILGVECLGVEKVTLKMRNAPPPPSTPWEQQASTGPAKTLVPPIWAPWSLMSVGAVICLYSFTIPQRVKG